MLSAEGAENMRGIERVITGVLLVAAVCGSAAFARSVGHEAATGGGAEVQLTQAPPQHVQSARAVQVPLYPLLTDHPTAAPAKPASKPSLADVPAVRSTPTPARRIVVTPILRRSTKPRASVQVPTPKPVVVQQPVRQAPPTPATPTQQSDSRILAKVPLTPMPTWEHVKGKGHGKLKNHPDDDASATPGEQQSGSLAPQSSSTITLVTLSPSAQPAAENDNDNGNGNGNGHGHGYGRLKHSGNDHD
jgi:hypothetical protein